MNAEVYVWLPPQYHEAAYAHRRFPVVELLPGYPGSPKSWFGSLRANGQLEPLMREGKVAPFILVAPRTTLLPGVDTGCANVPGTVNADTWLSIDVPRMVMDNFRAQPAPNGWAVAGYSAGAHCATKLAVAHPDRYRAAVSLSGYNDPVGERDSLAAQDPDLRRATNPYLMLARAAVPCGRGALSLRPAGRRLRGGAGAPEGGEGPDGRARGVHPEERGRTHHGAVAAAGRACCSAG